MRVHRALDLRLEECQEQPQLRLQMNVTGADGQLAIDPGPLEVETCAFPAVLQGEIPLELLRHPLGRFASLRKRQGMLAADVYVAHWRVPPA